MAASLERAGAFADGGSLRLSRAWPAPGGALSALYLPVGTRDLANAWTVVLSPSPDSESHADRGRLGCGLSHPSPDVRAFQVADDPELSRTAVLLDSDVFAETLAAWLRDSADLQSVRLLRYKPARRLTLEYRGPGGAPLLFGKALRRRHLERVAEAYERLGRSIAEEPQPLLAQPCGRVGEWGLLVWRPVAGTGLDRLLGGPAAARGAALAGQSLGRLHRCGAALSATHPRQREVATTRAWAEAAQFGFPGEAAAFGRAFEHLEETSSEAPASNLVPSHRDFHPGQLLVGRCGGTLLDLDDAALGEPELDAGNFLAHLDLLALRGARRTKRLAATFLDAYRRASDHRLDQERLVWYRASALLRLACVYRFRRRGAREAPRLLRRAVAWTTDDRSGSADRLPVSPGGPLGPVPGFRSRAAARTGAGRGSAVARVGPAPAPSRLEDGV